MFWIQLSSLVLLAQQNAPSAYNIGAWAGRIFLLLLVIAVIFNFLKKK
ncbi:MAG: hypothetical protein ACOYKN_16350 [Pirellula sp.]|jgi:hypothetical protein